MVSAKDFKERYIQGEITITPSRWAITTKEAIKAGVPSPHYFKGHYLIRCSIESIVERISQFY